MSSSTGRNGGESALLTAKIRRCSGNDMGVIGGVPLAEAPGDRQADIVSQKTPTRRVLPTSPFRRLAADEPAVLAVDVGDRVTHDRYGLGRVLSVIHGEYATVDFGQDAVLRVHLANRGLSKL
jgi:hypothetical protein